MFNNKNYAIMTTLQFFKIAESTKKFDTVELIHDELNETFIVQWKWTTMRYAMQKVYTDFETAREKYKERKNFAKMCN